MQGPPQASPVVPVLMSPVEVVGSPAVVGSPVVEGSRVGSVVAPLVGFVVALVGEEATVKRFFQEDDHVRLQPENDAMQPIRSKEVRVLGRVVGLLRTFG